MLQESSVSVMAEEVILAAPKRQTGSKYKRRVGDKRPKTVKLKFMALIADRLDEPGKCEESKEAFCRNHGWTSVTYDKFAREIQEGRLEAALPDVKKDEFVERCYELGMSGKVLYAQLWARMMGLISDGAKSKTEVKVDVSITADDRTRQLLEAERELNRAGHHDRVVEVQKESALLSS